MLQGRIEIILIKFLISYSSMRSTISEHPVSPPPAPPPSARPHTASDFRSRRYMRNKGGSLTRSQTTASHSLPRGEDGIATSITPVHTPRVLLTLKKNLTSS